MKSFTNYFRNAFLAAFTLAGVNAFADGTIEIAISDITATDAVASLTPSSDELLYYWNFMVKEDFDAKGGAEKAIENRIQVWKNLAANYDNTTWEEIMGYELQQYPMTESIADYFYDTLMFDTDYVVYAFGMDREGNVTAPVSTAEFRTLTPPKSDNTFDITVSDIVKGGFYMTATAHVQPSNSDTYMARFFTKTFLDRFDLTPGSNDEKKFIAQEMLYYVNKSEEIANGPHDFVYGRCHEGEEYGVVVMGLNDDMSPSTSLTVAYFVAEEEKNLQGTITLEVSDITPMNAHIKITPSSDEIRYYYGITKPDIIEKKGGVEMIPEKLIIDWWKYLAELYGGAYRWQDFIEMQTVTGPIDTTIADLVEQGELEEIYWNSEWVLYAVGFNLDGDVITEPAVEYFNTPDCDKSDMTFDIELVDLDLDPNYPNITRKYYKATVDIYPSNDDETFRANYFQTKYYDQYLEDGVMTDMFDFITRQFLPYSQEFSGPVRLILPGLPSTDFYGDPVSYYVMAMGWNEGPTTELNLFKFSCETSALSFSEAGKVTVKGNNGHISIEGDHSGAVVYSADGKLMGTIRGTQHLPVRKGLYIVKYNTPSGATKTVKVSVGK